MDEPEIIKNNLIRQISATVRWRESIQNMISMGVEEFIELGSGKVLTGLIKRIDRNVDAFSVETIEDIEEADSIRQEFKEWLNPNTDDHDILSLEYIGEGSDFDK